MKHSLHSQWLAFVLCACALVLESPVANAQAPEGVRKSTPTEPRPVGAPRAQSLRESFHSWTRKYGFQHDPNTSRTQDVNGHVFGSRTPVKIPTPTPREIHRVPPRVYEDFLHFFPPPRLEPTSPAPATDVYLTRDSLEALQSIPFSESDVMSLGPHLALFMHGVLVDRLDTGDITLGHINRQQISLPDHLIASYLNSERSAPNNIFVSSPTLYRSTRTAVASRPRESQPLVLYNKTNQAPASLGHTLYQPIQSAEIFHSIPKNTAEAARVHGNDADTNTNSYWLQKRSDMQSSVPIAKDIGRSVLFNESYADALVRLLNDAKARHVTLVVVVGEIRNEATHFPDGSHLPVSSMMRPGMQVAVIGCNSADSVVPPQGTIAVGMGTRINYAEAIAIASIFGNTVNANITRFLLQQPQSTLYDILLHMQMNPQPGEAPAAATAATLIVPVSFRFVIRVDGSPDFSVAPV
jgi:hypothetical protein